MTRALELKPYFHNNEDPCKEIGTLSTEIGPAATTIVKFGPKKHISVSEMILIINHMINQLVL